MGRAVGVDWGSKGWVCTKLTENRKWSISLQPSILSVWEQYGERADGPILIDIPIGLRTFGTRQCDIQAKRELDERRSSVFLTPPRAALTEPTYADAKTVTEDRTEHSLTTQAWRLLPQIQEVDDLLQSAVEPGMALRESHPEICFRKLSPGSNGLGSKHDDSGMDTRLSVLDEYVSGTTAAYEEFVAEYIDNEPAYARRFRSDNADDILDAMGLAVTGDVADGTFERFGGNEMDPKLEREIEIVYATK